ncbi:GNAT family N-acetyltransferase [Dactylosporangium sp. NPDC051541]|uniref:GNAT family N-acetyltransferase n=1 Tax=Dactylosporangium sp. NPDC051541 TaxID=3363977 RepID=UPI0037BA70D9
MDIRECTLRDVATVLEIVTASDIAALGEPEWTEEEIVATLTAPHNESWLAFDSGGTALAWAYLDNPGRAARDNVEVYAVPETGRAAFGPLLDLALDRIARRARDNGHAEVTARAGAVATEAHYIAALTERGFAFKRRYARMTRALAPDERCTDPRVRPVRQDELETFHRVLQTAFADTADFVPISYADWRESLAALPSIAWDEWLVAAVDGQIVGVLQSSEQGVERGEGWVPNLAVLREHRGRGIGAALLRAAFAIYAAKGRTAAGLGVDLTNPTGAYHLYMNVGMTVAFAADMYERAVPARD